MSLFGDIGNAIGGATHFVGGLLGHPAQQPQPNRLQPAAGNLQVTQNPQVQIPHVNLNTMQTVHLQPYQPNIHVINQNPQAHFDFWGQYAKNLVDTLTKHPAQLAPSKNPILNFAEQAIINPALRSPADITQGIVKTGTGIGEAASGANLGKSATKTLQGAGQLGVGVLNSPLGFLAGGGKVVEGGVGGTSTLAKTLLQGAKTGAAYGGAYGLSSGLQQGKNLPDQAKKALEQGALNAGIGAAFGTGLSAAGAGAGKLANSISASRGAEALDAAGAVAPTPTIKGLSKVGAKQAEQDAADMAAIKAHAPGATAKGVVSSANATQKALETAANSGNTKQLGKLLDQIPANDPYKSSMESMFRARVNAEIPTFSQAQKGVSKAGGYAHIENAPLPTRNTYAASQLGQSLGMDEKFLYKNATARGIDLQPYLTNLDNTTDPLTRVRQGGQMLKDITAGGSKPPVEGAAGELSTDTGKERGFITNAKTGKISPNLTQNTKDILNSKYIPQSDQEIAANTQSFLKQPLDQANSKITSTIAKTRSLSAQQTHTAVSTMYALDQAGQHDQAAELGALIAQKRTPLGQGLRGGGIFQQMSPQGLVYSANKALDGVKVATGTSDKISALAKQAGDLPIGSEQRQAVVDQLTHTVNSQLPRTKGGAFGDLWRTGLISGPLTVTKVGASQPFNVANYTAEQGMAGAFDKIQSLFNGGQRGTFASMEDRGKGLAQGFAAIPDRYKNDYSAPNMNAFTETMGHGNKVTQYEAKVMDTHAALTMPGYRSAYMGELANQAKLAANKQGLDINSAEGRQFIDAFKQAPTSKAQLVAQHAGEVATNSQRTAAGVAAHGIQSIPVVGRYIAPITRVPTAIGTSALYDHSGVKLAADTVRAIGNKIHGGSYTPEVQRAISEDLAKTATGVGGAGALGFGLHQAGILTTVSPTDPKERALWTAEGKQPNSIKIGNHWLSLNALGPIGIEMGIGAGANQGLKSGGAVGAAEQGLATGGGVLAEQPYVQGITNFGNTLKSPGQYAAATANKYVGSLVPGFLRQVAQGSDTVDRANTSDSPVRAIEAGIPGLRGNLPVQHTLYGQPVPGLAAANGGGLKGAILGSLNPARPTVSINQGDAATGELQRLYNTLGSQDAPPIAQPNKSKNTPGLNTPAGVQNMIAKAGPQIHAQLNAAVTNPTYSSLNDQQKSKLLGNIISGARSDAKIAISGKTIIGGSSQPNLSSNQVYYQDPSGKLAKIDLSATSQTVKTSSAGKLWGLYEGGKLKPNQLSAYMQKLGVQPLQAEMSYAKALPTDQKGAFVLDRLTKYPNSAGTLAQNGVLTTGLATTLFNNGSINPDQYRQLYTLAQSVSKYDTSVRKGGSGGGSGSGSRAVSKAATKGPALRLSGLKQPRISSNIKTVRTPRVTSTPKVRVSSVTPKAKQIVLA